MSPRYKYCGLTNENDVLAARAAGAGFAGFVFYPSSPRHLTSDQAAQLKPAAHGMQTVAVTVDADDELLARIQEALAPDFWQLHGSETPERAREVAARFGGGVIKAFKIKTAADLDAALAFEGADMLLFDAGDGRLPGGTGKAFDWDLLKGRDIPLPWFLSGGLHAGNVAEAVQRTGASLLDVSSGLESTPGIKDSARMQQFAAAVKAL